MGIWNRELESEEHRKRRVQLIRKAQSEGKILTHTTIDKIFQQQLEEKERPQVVEVISESEAEARKTKTITFFETETLKAEAETKAEELTEKAREIFESAELTKETLREYSKTAFSASLARKISVLKKKIDEENETDMEIRVSIVKAKGKWKKPKFSLVGKDGVIE